MLFDHELALKSDAKSLKTCFFEAFEFGEVAAQTSASATAGK